MAIERWVVAYVSMMETASKNILYVSHITPDIMASNNNIPVGLLAELTFQEDNIKKHSVLLNDSDSEFDDNGKGKNPSEIHTGEASITEFF